MARSNGVIVMTMLNIYLLTVLLEYLNSDLNFYYFTNYHKRGKIRWAKFSRFSQFSRALQSLPMKYKCLSLIILNNKHFWPRHHESISAKTSPSKSFHAYSSVLSLL